MTTLIIVESPAKAKKIQTYLGKDYIVLSSYGHICNLDIKKGKDAVEVDNNFKLNFSNLSDKKKVITQLKTASKKVKEVIIATDEDREGEAIGYHLIKLLKLDINETKRIIFNEITKPAILKAISNPEKLRINFVNAQFGRMALDHIVGFHLSPLLWKNINGPKGLSAGRVQSLVVKIIINREMKIDDFTEDCSYKISGDFLYKNNSIKAIMKNDISDFKKILKASIGQKFVIDSIKNNDIERKAPPPYTTSTLQQDISSQCNISTKQVMNIAQKLYEEGYITYHRTDSLNLSGDFLKDCEDYINKIYGEKYSETKHYKTKSSNAQEAHEAIRPTDLSRTSLTDNDIKSRVYILIWKRTVASQMSNQLINNIVITLKTVKYKEQFISNVEETIFNGFKILYNHKEDKDLVGLFKKLKEGYELDYKIIRADQTFSNSSDRYTESALVKDLEKKGIGRPSTYASMIEKVQDCKYVLKTDIIGKKRKLINYYIDQTKLYQEEKEIEEATKKNRFVSTKLGREINTFLTKNFGEEDDNELMNYNFTANLETHLDSVLEGDVIWTDVLKNFYKDFFPIYNKLNMSSSDKKDTFDKGRLVGVHPENKKPIYVRIGKFGPLAQIGEGSKTVKPQYINLTGCDLDSITLDDILNKAKYPKKIGKYKGDDILLLESKYGFCIKWNGGFYSLYDNEKENLDIIDEDKGVEVIERKTKKEAKKPLKILMNGRAEVLEGPYGNYIRYVSREGENKNIKIPKGVKLSEIDDDFVKGCIK